MARHQPCENSRSRRRPGPGLRLGIALLVSAAIPPGPGAAALLTVTTLDDLDAADGHCSLREAIVAANTDAPHRECVAGSGPDTIELDPGGIVTLASDLPTVTAGLTLRGRGSEESAIDGAGFEVIHFSNGISGTSEMLRVEALTITGGSADEGGAIYAGRYRGLEVVGCVLAGNRADVAGGAVRADLGASVLVERSWIADNLSDGAGGGLAALSGSLVVRDSTFSGNEAVTGSGGGIYAYANPDVALERSTFVANAAGFEGGAVAAVASGSFAAESLTIVDNSAGIDAGNDGDGGGLAFAGNMTATLVNSILAGNSDLSVVGATCPNASTRLGADVVSDGFNLVGAHECLETSFPLGQPNVNADRVGDLAAPIGPLLEPLGDHGGPTPTRPPTAASPAIDQGSCPSAVTDQRGYGGGAETRAVDDPLVADLADGCDSGSVERGGAPIVFDDGFESGATDAWSSTVP